MHNYDDTEIKEDISNIDYIKTINTQGTWNGNVYTDNGISYTFNEDGTITVNGTATANSTLGLLGKTGDLVTINGNYIILGVTNTQIVLRVLTFSGSYIFLGSNSSATTPSQLDLTTYTEGYIEIRVNNGAVLDNVVVKPMLTDTPKTDFEKYTGGQPSPNPDYEQPIEVMQGRQVVPIQKNRFDKSNANVLNCWVGSGSIVADSSTYLVNKTVWIPCKPNTTYTIKKALQRTVGNNRLTLGTTSEIPAGGVYLIDSVRNPDGTDKTSETITTSANAKYLVAFIYNQDSLTTFEEILDSLQILETIENIDYTVDLKSKNLLRQDQYVTTRTINGITFTNNGDGTFNITGTATAVTTINFLNGTSQIGLRSGKTYYLYSSQPYNAITFNLSIIFLQDGVRRYLIANSKITTSGEISDMKLAFYIQSGNTVNAQNVKLMLVEGSTATDTDYEPYYDYKLAGIGDYKDNFYTDKGKWYLKKNIGEHNLIGQMAGAGVNNAFFTTEINDYALADNIPYSNRFKGISNINGAGALTNADDNVISFINSTDYIRFYIKSTKFADYNAMNEFLTNNKTYIYYLLKQPITTEITAPTLINQLNALYQAM